MAQSTRSLCTILYLFFACYGLVLGQSKADCIIRVASSQVGVREQGRNSSQAIDQYLKSVNARPGQPWCAAFVYWVHAQCAVSAPKSAWSPSWFPRRNLVYQANHTVHQALPQSADVFGIYFNNLKRVAHVGIIENWPEHGQFTTTIEGNTNEAGSREGDGVYRKRRHKRQIYQVSRWTTRAPN